MVPIRRANAIYPVTAVQSEYSLWTRDYEGDTLPVVRELGVGFVPYYSLGRGFFAGSAKPSSEMDVRDNRRNLPRFSDANLPRNLELLAQFQEIANAMYYAAACTVMDSPPGRRHGPDFLGMGVRLGPDSTGIVRQSSTSDPKPDWLLLDLRWVL